MKIVSWNVNGIRAIVKKEFFQAIGKMKADIICLQETKAQVEQVKDTLSPLKDYHLSCNSAEKKGYSSTAVLSKIKPLGTANDMGLAEHDNEGRIICNEYPDFYLINVYVPNSGQGLKRLDYRQTWDRDFLSYLKKKEKIKPVIACGDFNVAHEAIDLKNDKANYNKTSGYTQVEIDGMGNFIKSGFIDTYRHFYPEEVAYSYWSYRFKARERNTGWRIDYFLISKSLIGNVKAAAILPQYYGSDHCPVQLDIEF